MIYFNGPTVSRTFIEFHTNIFRSGKPGDRAMPTMASGMEAEEETEHHLQRAIATETVRTHC